MKQNEKSLLWVVYRITIHGKPSGMNAVCLQSEWEAMERAQPAHRGHLTHPVRRQAGVLPR